METETFPPQVPEADIKASRLISAVWLIPLVAALMAGWLVYRTLSEQGPAITLTFETATGLESGKTQVKYKDVVVGAVDTVKLDADSRRVVVTADMEREAEDLLTDTARFWVVRPRLGIKEISGLGTLVSGAFIELDPGRGGKAKLDFQGLDAPPVIKADAPGGKFVLTTADLGSVSHGSPVYFRGIEVGEVLGYELTKDKTLIRVHVFVHAPHDKLVRKNTRFWNVSGLQVSLDANGMQVKTGTLQSLVLGGVAFETPDLLAPGKQAADGTRFVLFKTQGDVEEVSSTEKIRFILYFDSSVRGLGVGAPVEFRGIRVGSVVDIKLQFEPESNTFRIPVLVEIMPQSISLFDQGYVKPATDFAKRKSQTKTLIDLGLRARLKTGSFLTGQLFVDLDLHPQTAVKMVGTDPNVLEIPTLPPSLEEITNSLTALVEKLQRVPLDTISAKLVETLEGAGKLVNAPETRDAMSSLRKAASELERLIRNVDRQVIPNVAGVVKQATATLKKAEKAIASMETVVAKDSPVRFELRAALEEISSSARSVRQLADYLKRNPNALLMGKPNR